MSSLAAAFRHNAGLALSANLHWICTQPAACRRSAAPCTAQIVHVPQTRINAMSPAISPHSIYVGIHVQIIDKGMGHAVLHKILMYEASQITRTPQKVSSLAAFILQAAPLGNRRNESQLARTLSACIYVYMCTHIRTHTHIHFCMYVCMYMHMYMFLYMYMCLCMYIYNICICVYMLLIHGGSTSKT